MKNNLKNIILLTTLLAVGLDACTGDSHNHDDGHQQNPEKEHSLRLTAHEVEASGAYLSYDHEQRPVLCWTESISLDKKESFVLKYAVFNPATEAFGEPVTVPPSIGTRAHPESMNKVAFKADGTVVTLFAVKHPTEDNPFAGSILYSLSTDRGKSWTKAAYLHSDTLPDYGRGYFDLATLPDGEVGAVWLDGRFAEEDTGSALFFAKTTAGKGFGNDQQIGESTCECCRTDIAVNENGRIYVAYRDISFPVSGMGKQLRDISYSYSDDLGKTFSPAKALSDDHWAIEGCPHTGPSLAANEQGLHAVWFTEGGGSGVYYSRAADFGGSFAPREELSKSARHPQLLALTENRLVMVWDEATSPSEIHAAALNRKQQHGHGHESVPENSSSKIMIELRDAKQKKERWMISGNGAGNAAHPAVLAIGHQKVVVAWAQEEAETKGIYYSIVNLGRP